MEHDHLIEETLHDLTICIVQYIYNYHKGYKFSQDLHKSGQRLFQSIEGRNRIVIDSIVRKTVASITDEEEEEQEVENAVTFRFLNLLEFTFD